MNLGLDLGASGLRAFLDSSDELVGQLHAGPSAASREQDTIRLILELGEQLALPEVDTACLGMSGYTLLAVNHQEIADAIHRAFGAQTVLMTSDMATAHYAHFGEGCGTSVVVGTGSLSFGIGKDSWLRIDGLGAALGDFGSAHWIGFNAMRQAKRESELNLNRRLLSELELQLGDSNTWPVRLARGEISTFEIAKLAQIVDSESHSDTLAARIMSEAGELAAESAIATAERIGEKSVSFGGSVLSGRNSLAAEAFLAKLKKAGLKARPQASSLGFGAARMAQNSRGQRVQMLLSEQLMKQMDYAG